MGFELVFQKPPASVEEQAIAELISRFVGAMNEKNLLGLYTALHHEARMEMAIRRGAFLSKDEYLAEMQHLWSEVSSVVYRNITINFDKDQHEVLLHFEAARQSSKMGEWVVSKRYLRCQKNEVEWLILESGYIQ
jgi:hypothetical protein